MLFLEYERAKDRLYDAQRIFEAVLLEKERLFTITQPKAITYDKDNVETSPSASMLDNYIIALEEKKIEEKLAPYRRLLKDRAQLLEIKERELRKSPDRHDKVYVCRFLDGMSIRSTARHLNYYKSEIYRCLQHIKKKNQRNVKKGHFAKIDVL